MNPFSNNKAITLDKLDEKKTLKQKQFKGNIYDKDLIKKNTFQRSPFFNNSTDNQRLIQVNQEYISNQNNNIPFPFNNINDQLKPKSPFDPFQQTTFQQTNKYGNLFVNPKPNNINIFKNSKPTNNIFFKYSQPTDITLNNMNYSTNGLYHQFRNFTVQINNQLATRDTKIKQLESEVSLLKNTVNLLTTVVNQIKNNSNLSNQKSYLKQRQQSIKAYQDKELQSRFKPKQHFKTQKSQDQPSYTLPPSLFNSNHNSNSNSRSLIFRNNNNNTTNNNNNPNFQNNPSLAIQIMNKLAFPSQNSIFDDHLNYIDKQYSTRIKKLVQVTSVQVFTIRNHHGAISFTQNVDFTKFKSKRLSDFVEINNSNVAVNQHELKNKRCRVTLYDFQYFSTSGIDIKQIILENLTQLTAKAGDKFTDIHFDYQTGKLSLTCKGF